MTTPLLLTIAITELKVLHDPVDTASDSVIVDPMHTDEGPVIVPDEGEPKYNVLEAIHPVGRV